MNTGCQICLSLHSPTGAEPPSALLASGYTYQRSRGPGLSLTLRSAPKVPENFIQSVMHLGTPSLLPAMETRMREGLWLYSCFNTIMLRLLLRLKAKAAAEPIQATA